WVLAPSARSRRARTARASLAAYSGSLSGPSNSRAMTMSSMISAPWRLPITGDLPRCRWGSSFGRRPFQDDGDGAFPPVGAADQQLHLVTDLSGPQGHDEVL